MNLDLVRTVSTNISFVAMSTESEILYWFNSSFSPL